METSPIKISCEIELQPGEKLSLPDSLVGRIGPGHWLVTVEPSTSGGPSAVRDHSAFLSSYVTEDEGLYDDYPPR